MEKKRKTFIYFVKLFYKYWPGLFKISWPVVTISEYITLIYIIHFLTLFLNFSSPGWVQIKCELRLLSKFSFNLNADWELQNIQDENKPLQDGVKDMLVTHHLFSWDL